MSGPLTKARLLELFDRLNERLKQADQHAEVYIVGGAMMALAHDAQRVTDDVDSHIRQGREAVTKAVAEIADEEGLSRYWLNEAVTLRHLPEDADRGERRVYRNTHLTIQGASTSRMKLHAGRPLEAHMAESRLRGHIYLTERTLVEFATRQRRTDRPLERNVGPEPVRRALAEILRRDEEPESWLRRLHAEAAERTRAPSPALWNSPALVVTGAMASRALCAALEHEADYPAETIDRLMQEADVGENEAAAMFEEVTGKPLRAKVGAARCPEEEVVEGSR